MTAKTRARTLNRLGNIDEIEVLARRRLPRSIYDFVQGGADDEVTTRANRVAFQTIKFRPRVLRDVSRRDQSTVVAGQHFSTPVLLAPTGLPRLAHPDGDIAAAQAATRRGSTMLVSSASSYPLEAIADSVDTPLWFQLYAWRDRKLTGSLMERAHKAGYRALCVTVDVPIVGNRERDRRNGMTIPPRMLPGNILDIVRHSRWLVGMLRGGRDITFANLTATTVRPGDSAFTIAEYVNTTLTNPGQTWEEMAWIRKRWQGPLLVKGVMTPEDAQLAADHGADGVVVSNHGGRQLDGLPATVEVLPEIVAAVGNQLEVLLDGGIRRGSDVVKALALGARACLIGRPYWYGLAVGGAAGVERVLEILETEIDRTLALVGCARIADINRSLVTTPADRASICRADGGRS